MFDLKSETEVCPLNFRGYKSERRHGEELRLCTKLILVLERGLQKRAKECAGESRRKRTLYPTRRDRLTLLSYRASIFLSW